jgi:hypothetical protein
MMNNIRHVPLDRLVLVLTLSIFGAFAVYRAVHLWLTGFYVSDEFSYVMTAVNGTYYVWGHTFLLSHGQLQRPLFIWVNSLMFQSLGIRAGSGFAIFLPFYLMLWNSLTILCAYGILKVLGLGPRVTVASLLGMVFLVSPLVLGQGFLTEPMSLGMAMLGVLLLVVYAWTERQLGIFMPLFAALAFGAATYTREPYQIFLYTGWVPVALISIKRFIRRGERRITRRLLVTAVPSLLFLATSYALLGGLFLWAGQSQTLTAFPRNVVQEQTVPALRVILGSDPLAWAQRALGMVTMFFGGVLLGWNPILASLAAAGLILLMKRVRKTGSDVSLMALGCATISVAQYFGVLALMAATPEFTLVGNLSTIIRYSQMATPAYFLSVPFSFSRLGRKTLAVIFIVLIVFGVSAAGQYQQYLQTHLSYGYPYSQGQPIFSLDYRTPLARLRDHIAAHPGDNLIIVFAEPNPKSYYDNFTLHWQMIPGTEHLPSVKFYPYPPQNEFFTMRPSRFYLYGEGDGAVDRVAAKAPYLVAFLETMPAAEFATHYEVRNVETIHKASDAFLVVVALSWNE